METTNTPATSASAAAPAQDWTAFLGVYAELIDDLDAVLADPAPGHQVRVPEQVRQGHSVPTRGLLLECPPAARARALSTDPRVCPAPYPGGPPGSRARPGHTPDTWRSPVTG